MSKSVTIEPFEQAMVNVALARLRVAVALLTGTGVVDATRVVDQIQAAVSELETNLPFTTQRQQPRGN